MEFNVGLIRFYELIKDSFKYVDRCKKNLLWKVKNIYIFII